MKRALDAAEITALYETYARQAVTTFNKEKECAPKLFGVIMGAKSGTIEQQLLIDPILVRALHSNANTKDALMDIVIALLKLESPHCLDCIVHISEVWISEGRLPIDDKAPAPVDDPARTEGIQVTLHTRERSYAGLCRIVGAEGSADRHAIYGSIEKDAVLHGRFAMQDRAGHSTH